MCSFFVFQSTKENMENTKRGGKEHERKERIDKNGDNERGERIIFK